MVSSCPGSTGKHVYARASVLYDVLNRVALDATLASCRTAEADLAAQHLAHVNPGDLVIRDRGYASYRMLALDSQGPGDALIRCPSGRFKTATAMLRGEGPDDCIVTVLAPPGFAKDPKNQGLPTSLTIRFVRVILPTGECEVLATTLLDIRTYPTAVFKERYYLRWGVETFYGILKMTNESLRSRFGEGTLSSTVASRWINEAVERGAIRPYDPDSSSRRHARYVPDWA